MKKFLFLLLMAGLAGLVMAAQFHANEDSPAVFHSGILANGTSISNLNASALASGTVPPDRLGSGSALQAVRRNAANTALEFFTLSGGGDALTADPLSQFAATTSSQFFGVISDESGNAGVVPRFSLTSLTSGDLITWNGSTWVNAAAIALGTQTTGNYVADVVGTANEITSTHTPGEGSTATLSLPATIDLGGKTSLEIPNSAGPTTDAFGEIAGDNNAWASGRGAVQFFDGTANTYLVGVLASDTPSNGQVPKWNTGGTITWENDATGGGSGSETNLLYADGAVAIQSLFDDPDEILWIRYPDGTSAGGITNGVLALTSSDGPGTGMLYLGASAYLDGSDVYLREGGRAAFRATVNARQVLANNGTDVAAEFGTYEAPVFSGITFDIGNWGNGFLFLNGSTVETTDTVDEITTGTLIVETNVIWSAGQLGPAGAVTNYWIDMQSTNLQWIVATGHVFLVDFTNAIAGASKYLSVTNPFWGSSNINVFVPTNMPWLGATNGRGIAASPMHTNWFFPIGYGTNFVDFSFTALGTTRQSIRAAGVHATLIP